MDELHVEPGRRLAKGAVWSEAADRTPLGLLPRRRGERVQQRRGIDPMALGRFHPVTAPVLGHVGITARRLSERLTPSPDRVDQRGEVAQRWAIWREEKRRRLADDHGHGMASAAVSQALAHPGLALVEVMADADLV